MVVDSTISASALAHSRTPSCTRLRAQMTTSASPMSLLPLRVSRSGAPGPAPINHTLPKPGASSGKDHGGQIRPPPADHLTGRRDFLAVNAEPGAVHGVLQPPLLPRDPQHFPEPASALVADDRVEPRERLPQRLFPGREGQQREPSV